MSRQVVMVSPLNAGPLAGSAIGGSRDSPMRRVLAADAVTSAVREVTKAFEELVPTSVLKDRALAIAIELRHPAYDYFYLVLAEQRNAQLVTADERLIRRCADTAFMRLVRSL